MSASSFTRRTLMRANVREWAWWQLPANLRTYVGVVVVASFVLAGLIVANTTWHAHDALKYLVLLTAGLVSVAATPRSAYRQGRITADFITVWVLPVAILLPPVYAMTIPVPMYILTQWWVHRGAVYRRVFTVANIALTYGAASLLFRVFPVSFAGTVIGGGTHALTWVVAVAICEQAARKAHQVLIMGAIKLADPTVRLRETELSRELLVADFAEFDLGVMITIVVAVNIYLAVIAVPTVLLARRFMMHGPLVEQTRIDTKTGLLNAATWEREAAVEVEHAVRVRAPLAVALVDIDHFKLVNDTYGHLVGDRVLRALADALRSQLRAYDLAGRFGGEEFIILLPQARETDARIVAERLRTYVAALEIPVDDDPHCITFVRLTISVGVAAIDGVSRELTDLMAAADAALYYAKETGRNRTHVIPASPQPS
jgi:diguanylate cyclase (GGDEF)-like protein